MMRQVRQEELRGVLGEVRRIVILRPDCYCLAARQSRSTRSDTIRHHALRRPGCVSRSPTLWQCEAYMSNGERYKVSL